MSEKKNEAKKKKVEPVPHGTGDEKLRVYVRGSNPAKKKNSD